MSHVSPDRVFREATFLLVAFVACLTFAGTMFSGCADPDGGAEAEGGSGHAREEPPAVQPELVERLREMGAGVELGDKGQILLVTHREGGFNNDDLLLLSDLPAIEVLRVLGGEARMSGFDAPPNVTDEGISYLSGLTSLKRLNLTETGLTDSGVNSLSTLDNLEELILVGTQVTDAGVEALRSLTKLKRLELASTGITDATLAWLEAFPNLTWLDIHSTKVTDAGLEHLARCRTLTTLDLVDCPAISDEAVEKLSQALPNCEILR